MKLPPAITSLPQFGRLACAAFLLSLLAVALDEQHVHAATLIVTTTADTGPDAPAPGSLRAALGAAIDGDTIDATGINGTIVLSPGAVLTAELVVDKSVTILGPGAASLAVDGNALSRVFHVTPGHKVAIDGVSIMNGDSGVGAGIFNDQSELLVSNCVVSLNSANTGGGILNDAPVGSTAILVVNKCVFSGNSAVTNGGAIRNERGILTVVDSTISGNLASSGAGIHNVYGTVTVKGSTLSGNSATSQGGAIDNTLGATAAVANCTLTGNSAGAVPIAAAGIFNNGSNLLVANCTFSGNSGAGIYNVSADATLKIGASIMKATGLPANIYNDGGTVTSLGFNLLSDGGVVNFPGSTGELSATDQINTDPMLGPLANNGGPTLTHLPQPGSPAIDRGTSDTLAAFGLTTDQRGLPRTVDDLTIANAPLSDGSDVGAVEAGAASPPPPALVADLLLSLGADKTNVKQGDQLTYTVTVQNFGPDNATNVVVDDTLSSGTTFVSAKANRGNVTAPVVGETGTVSWQLGDLANAAQEAAQIQVTVTIKGKGTITNTATVASDATDPDPANNNAALIVSVGAGGGKGGKK